MKQPELTHHGSPVIVNALAGESVAGIEGEDAAEREFHASAGCRQSSSPWDCSGSDSGSS